MPCSPSSRWIGPIIPSADGSGVIATKVKRRRSARSSKAIERFDGDYRLRLVGASGVARTTFSDSCGVIPDDLPDPDVFPSGTITGNVCWEILASDAASVVLFDKPFLGDQDVFMALH